MARKLNSIPAVANHGLAFKAQSVSNRTSPAIASILFGLLPAHRDIYNSDSAKRSPILSVQEIASFAE